MMDEWKITGEQSKVRNRIEIPGTGISKFVEKNVDFQGGAKMQKKEKYKKKYSKGSC